jgi:hypothetical protein
VTTPRLALAIAALALLLRIAAAMTAESVWRDEANDIFLCRNARSVSDFLRTLRAEGSPPLRFAVECALHRTWPTSIAPARAAVVVFGTAADAVTLAVAWQAFGPAAGLVAGALMATSPYFVRYSVELRGYSQFQLLAALYALALLHLIRRSTLRGAVFAGIAGAALALTHYYGALLVMAGTASAFIVYARGPAKAGLVLVSAAIVVLLTAPWVSLFAAQLSSDLRPWSVPDRKGLDLIAAVLLPLGRWSAVLTVAIAVACWARTRGAGDARATTTRDAGDTRAATRIAGGDARDAVLLLLGGAIGANVVGWALQFVPGVNARLEPQYLVGPAVWALPPLAAAVAASGARVNMLPHALRRRQVILTALLVAIGVSQAADVRAWLRPRSPAAEIATAIARDGRPGDLIVIVPPAHASTFNFYYDGSLEQWAPPFRGRTTNMPWEGLVAKLQDDGVLAEFVDDLDGRLQRGGRVWFVSGGGAEADRGRDTTYAQALFRIRRELLCVLHARAQPNPVELDPQRDYWEPMEATLFKPMTRNSTLP